MREDGAIFDSGSYPNTSFDASHYAKLMVERYGECKAVVESTGNMCMKTYEAFESNGVMVKLANSVKTRAIAEARVKTDKLDSKVLAHLLRADLIAECYVPSREVRLSRLSKELRRIAPGDELAQLNQRGLPTKTEKKERKVHV